MSVFNSDNKLLKDCSDVLSYPFAFKIFKDTDLKVSLINPETQEETALVLGVDYEVKISRISDGGSIELYTSHPGYQLYAYRKLDLIQPEEVPTEGYFPESTIEDALDRGIMISQQLQEQLDRSAQLSGYSDTEKIAFEDPVDGMVLQYQVEGKSAKLINYDIVKEMSDFRTEVDANVAANKAAQDAVIEQYRDVATQEILSFETETNGTLTEMQERITSNQDENVQNIEQFKTDVNTTIDVVKEAAGKVNELEQAVEEAKTAAQTATSKADETQEVLVNAVTEMNSKLTIAESSMDSRLSSATATMNEKLSAANTAVENATQQANLATQKAQEIIDFNPAKTDLSNLSEVGEKHFLNKQQITNCLLEVPQRIKLELNDGTLTLKAGSVVTVPYGSEDRTAEFPIGSKFLVDSLTVVDTSFTNNQFFVVASVDEERITNSVGTDSDEDFFYCITVKEGATSNRFSQVNLAISGTTAPAGSHLFYDTTNNILKYYQSGVATEPFCSLPIAICTRKTGVITSVKQVFNGMGYIGSCWWVDKGVKYLVANGRNADGTLKNIEAETDSILITSDLIGSSIPKGRIGFLGININNGKPFLSSILANNCFEQSTMPTTLNKYTGFAGCWYNPETNKQYTCSGTTGTPNWVESYKGASIIKYDLTSGSSLLNVGYFRKTFRAVDYSDKSTVSSWSMPSSKYINLTLGADGDTYIAPANGWFSISKTAIGSGTYFLNMYNMDTKNNSRKLGMTQVTTNTTTGSSAILTNYIPAKKGDTIQIAHNLKGDTIFFRFVYAEGEV